MKKLVVFLLAACVLLATSGCAFHFGVNPPATKEPDSTGTEQTKERTRTPADTASSTESTTQPPAPTEPIWTDPVVFEEISSGKFSDGFGAEIAYDYSIYYLREDLPGAKEFNAVLQEGPVKLMKEEVARIDAAQAPTYNRISCEVFEHEGLIALIVAMDMWEYSWTGYNAYYFDAVTGKTLGSNSDYLKTAGISDAEFLSATKQASKEWLATANKGIPQEELDDALERTDYLVEQYPVFPAVDKDGVLRVVVPIASPVGADYYYQWVQVEIGT